MIVRQYLHSPSIRPLLLRILSHRRMPGNVSTASTSLNKGKRKAPTSQADSESKSKKQKPTATVPSSTTNSSELAPNGQPTNKVLPTSISFPKKILGSLRIASWNVSGLAAAQKKVR